MIIINDIYTSPLRLFQSPFTTVGISSTRPVRPLELVAFPFTPERPEAETRGRARTGGTCPPAAGRAQRRALSFPRAGSRDPRSRIPFSPCSPALRRRQRASPLRLKPCGRGGRTLRVLASLSVFSFCLDVFTGLTYTKGRESSLESVFLLPRPKKRKGRPKYTRGAMFMSSSGGASGEEPACQRRRQSPPGRSPGRGMATHSRALAWRIPRTEESGGLQSLGSHRVGHD